MQDQTSVSVVVITYRRPVELGTCLDHLDRQTRPADEIVVVGRVRRGRERVRGRADTAPSAMSATPAVVAIYQLANRALALVTGDIIAFLDDDAFACTGLPRTPRCRLSAGSHDEARMRSYVERPAG